MWSPTFEAKCVPFAENVPASINDEFHSTLKNHTSLFPLVDIRLVSGAAAGLKGNQIKIEPRVLVEWREPPFLCSGVGHFQRFVFRLAGNDAVVLICFGIRWSEQFTNSDFQ